MNKPDHNTTYCGRRGSPCHQGSPSAFHIRHSPPCIHTFHWSNGGVVA